MSNLLHTITEEQIRNALDKFERSGGLIKKLPDEIVPPRNYVGMEQAVYEPVLGQ